MLPLRVVLKAGILSGAIFAAQPSHAYDCIELKCTEMNTCAEAHYKFSVCGHTKRDADNDGIPCEDLCGKDLKNYLSRFNAVAPAAPQTAAETKKPTTAAADPELSLTADGVSDAANELASSETFTCAGKRTCKQMDSCDEAKFYLSKCGVKSLDGDRDGVPCNRLCR